MSRNSSADKYISRKILSLSKTQHGYIVCPAGEIFALISFPLFSRVSDIRTSHSRIFTSPAADANVPTVILGASFMGDFYPSFFLFFPRRDSSCRRARVDKVPKWIAVDGSYDFENYANSVVAIQGGDLGRPKIT